eukprot:m.136601 g.136601  ORF g.136601 m.136601 type:complete len:802 (-) comp16028_c0_seq1:221-2626(-)
MCCGCKSQYKRKVDAAFPAAPDDGINQSAMGPLNFYASTHQGKLPKMARYLNKRTARALSRDRRNEVICSMHVYRELITQCHNDVHLFLDPFLDAVERLLETKDDEYQTQAVHVFGHFATFEVRTPTYSRRVEGLVALLSSMSFPSNNSFTERLAGVTGLQSLVLKASHDDASLWQPFHLAKLVPALLLNLESAYRKHVLNESVVEAQLEVGEAAERATKEVLIHSGLNNIKDVLTLFVEYWTTNNHCQVLEGDAINFAQYCIKLCISTLPASQHHIVLDTTFKAAPNVSRVSVPTRVGIMHLVGYMLHTYPKISSQRTFIATAAQTLQQLRYLEGAEENVRQQLIDITQDTLLALANTLPAVSVVETMTFMLGQVETSGDKVQPIIVSMTTAVSKACEVLHLGKGLPSELSQPILTLCCSSTPPLRNAAVELLDTRLRCQLEEQPLVAPATQQTRRASTLTNLLDSFSRSVLQGQQGNGAATASTILVATAKDRHYFGKIFEGLITTLFASICKVDSVEEQALVCWGDLALRMATLFGPSYAVRTLSGVLALQESEASPRDALRAAFVAVFLKRVAVAYSLERLQAAIDDLVEEMPQVLELTAKLGPAETFELSSSDEVGEYPVPVSVLERGAVKALLEKEHFAVEHLHHLDKLFVRSTTLMSPRKDSTLGMRTLVSDDTASVVSTGTIIDRQGLVSFSQLKTAYESQPVEAVTLQRRLETMQAIFSTAPLPTEPTSVEAVDRATYQATFSCQYNLLNANWKPAVQVTAVLEFKPQLIESQRRILQYILPRVPTPWSSRV